MAKSSPLPLDTDLLQDLHKLLQVPALQPGASQHLEVQVLAAAQIDALCLSFMKQREALFARKRRICSPGGTDPMEKEAIQRWISQAQQVIREAEGRMKAGIESHYNSMLIHSSSNLLPIMRGLLLEHELIDAEIAAIDQRIAQYRTIADKILKGLNS